jgi:hypothetical protein
LYDNYASDSKSFLETNTPHHHFKAVYVPPSSSLTSAMPSRMISKVNSTQKNDKFKVHNFKDKKLDSCLFDTGTQEQQDVEKNLMDIYYDQADREGQRNRITCQVLD